MPPAEAPCWRQAGLPAVLGGAPHATGAGWVLLSCCKAAPVATVACMPCRATWSGSVEHLVVTTGDHWRHLLPLLLRLKRGRPLHTAWCDTLQLLYQ